MYGHSTPGKGWKELVEGVSNHLYHCDEGIWARITTDGNTYMPPGEYNRLWVLARQTEEAIWKAKR
jgi:hypothetical protein